MRRVTARHILLPTEEVAVTLKQKIRNSKSETSLWMEEAFIQAAEKYSRDEETRKRGGLLGVLVPQGYCRSILLDEACFKTPLGTVAGPIESEYGWHLLLVTERTNCFRIDGINTKLRPKEGSWNGELVPSEQVGRVDAGFVAGQAAFWFSILIAGGFLAETLSTTTTT